MAQSDFTTFMNIVLEEYQKWKCHFDDDPEQQQTGDLVSMGAMGACANIVQRLSGMEPGETVQSKTPKDTLNFGARVRIARRTRGMQQAELGAAVGFHAATISQIECGTISRDAKSATAVAEFLGID